MKHWHNWKHDGFTHHLNLSAVVQWLYRPKRGDATASEKDFRFKELEVGEHAHVWLAGHKQPLRFEGRTARRFNKAMLRFSRKL